MRKYRFRTNVKSLAFCISLLSLVPYCLFKSISAMSSVFPFNIIRVTQEFETPRYLAVKGDVKGDVRSLKGDVRSQSTVAMTAMAGGLRSVHSQHNVPHHEIGDMIPRDAHGEIIPLSRDLGSRFLYARYNAEKVLILITSKKS